MARAKVVLGLVATIGVGAGAASIWLPPVVWPDAPVPPYLERRYAYVIGSAGGGFEAASGGSGLTGAVEADAEFVQIMGAGIRPCP